MKVLWYMVPEIWRANDWIFCHLGPFFVLLPPWQTKKLKFWKIENNTCKYYHFSHLYHKWQLYDVSFLGYEVWHRFFVILGCFLPFYPPTPNIPKNQNFKKLKKKPWGIIILHMCTINDNHMMYGSWDIECDGQIYLSFWTIFCSLGGYRNKPKN